MFGYIWKIAKVIDRAVKRAAHALLHRAAAAAEQLWKQHRRQVMSNAPTSQPSAPLSPARSASCRCATCWPRSWLRCSAALSAVYASRGVISCTLTTSTSRIDTSSRDVAQSTPARQPSPEPPS